MKRLKILLFFLSTIVGMEDLFAQFPDVNKAFGDYKAKYPASRLHFVFNQPFYAPGDTIFFSAWHLNESQKLFPGRQVGSLDLIAADGHAVRQIHFKIEDGRSTNQLALPKDLEPGSYTLLAYTNWMRNFNDDWFYRKRIEIKGKNEILPAFASMNAGVEGGDLVAGISNHLVVTADYPGATVTIRNQSGEEVASASLDSTGVASIDITPVDKQVYTVTGPNNTKAQLPPVKEDGVSIKFSGDNFTLASAGQYRNKELLGVFTSHGKIIETRRIRFNDGKTTVTLPGLMNGLFQQLFVIDQAGVVVASRVFAIDAAVHEGGKISVAPEVSQRQNVTMSVDLPAMTDVSVTVYQADLFKTQSLKQSFILSELPDVLQWAERFPEYEKSLNTFLVTQQWSRINWAEIFSNEKKLQFPNYSILTEKGTVRSRTTGELAPDSTNVIVYLQKNTMGYDTYTRNGRFEIPFSFDFWDTDYLFVTLQNKSRDLSSDYEVVFEQDSINIPAITPGRQLRTESFYGNYALKKQLISNSYTYFARTKNYNDTIRSLNAIFEDELGEVDVEVNVEKYVVFPTMEDLLREIIPFVQFRKTGIAKGVRMMLQYPTGNRVSKSNPLYIVDGIMTRNTDFFMSLKPKDILMVKVANDPRNLQQLGKIGENGVLMVESKKGTLADSLRAATNISIIGLNSPVAFHNIKKSLPRVPDLRSTLFWQGKVSTGNAGKLELSFTTSDDTGPVKIVIQGMTSEGVPIYLERPLTVRFQKEP